MASTDKEFRGRQYVDVHYRDVKKGDVVNINSRWQEVLDVTPGKIITNTIRIDYALAGGKSNYVVRKATSVIKKAVN